MSLSTTVMGEPITGLASWASLSRSLQMLVLVVGGVQENAASALFERVPSNITIKKTA